MESFCNGIHLPITIELIFQINKKIQGVIIHHKFNLVRRNLSKVGILL